MQATPHQAGRRQASSSSPDLLALLRISHDSPLPLAAQLRQQLEWLLTSGQIQPGDRLPPVRTLACALGIHRHTVLAAYRALESSGRLELRQGHGSTVLAPPHAPAAALPPAGPSFTVGLLVPGLNAFYTPFVMGIDEVAAHGPWLPLVCYTHDQPDLAARQLNLLLSKQVDGLIAVSLPRAVSRLDFPATPPVVYVDDPDRTENVVLLNTERGAFLATDHLLSHGHRRIALISGPLSWFNIAPVLAGFKRALRRAGLSFDPDLIAETPAFTVEAGRQAALKLLSLPSPPTAVFGSADPLAIGAMQAVNESGRRVPEDVAIVGYNNMEIAAWVSPGLTTATAPSYEMGVAAMTMLLELIAGRKPERSRIVLPTRLIVRRSCGCEADTSAERP